MQLSDNKVELVARPNKRVFRDGDRIVKVFNSSKPAGDVFAEALNLARVGKTAIKHPAILEVSQLEDGSWALATEYVPGTTMAELMAEASDEEYDALLEQFVDLQIQIQSTPAPALLSSQKDKVARMIGKAKTVDASTRYDLQMRVARTGAGIRVCHGDFNPSNVIVTDEGELYVCDWAHVTQGLPAADAAMTYILLAVDSVARADKYLALFCEKAHVPVQEIQYWLPVVAAAELSRGRAENEEFLTPWIESSNDFE